MTNDHCTCAVEVSPEEVDAGADLTLAVQVTPRRQDGLRGARLSVCSADGIELAQSDLAQADDEEHLSADVVVAAPQAAGHCVYRVAVIVADKNGSMQELASAEAGFTVTAHALQLNAWDVPTAIEAGAPLKFKVGVRCSAGCCLADRTVSVIAPGDEALGAARLGPEVWPGTEALYVADIEHAAPSVAGTSQWEIRTDAWDCDLPHDTGSLTVALRVVEPSDCEVTVEAVDRATQAPLKDARVVIHPYRAVTDANGIARVRVRRGQYDVLVAASKYVAVSTAVAVAADMVTRTELDAEPPWISPDEDPGV